MAVTATVTMMALAVASACAPATHEADDGGAMVIDLPDKNIERWVMPFDAFDSSALAGKKGYATALLLTDCVTSQGIDAVRVPYMEFDEASTMGPWTRDTITRARAEAIGYHDATSSPPAELQPWQDYRRAPRSEAELTATDACHDEIGDDLPSWDAGTLNFVSDFNWTAFEGAMSQNDVEAAAVRWRECMAPQGIEDLPQNPYEMPTESIRERFGLNAGKDARPAPPTPAEIDLALADVDCRESSGYQQALYDAIWEREARLLEENQAAFEEQRAAIEKTDAEIDRIIAQYATAGGSS